MLSQFGFVLKIKNQSSFYPFVPHEISVLIELLLGHLRYRLTDVPPQPNSLPDLVLCGVVRLLPDESENTDVNPITF
jgi:hypothetical protein